MKRIFVLLLAMVWIAGMFSGCSSAGPAVTDPEQQPSQDENTVTVDTEPSGTAETTLPTDTGIALPGDGSAPLGLGQFGKLRLTYTGNRSGVRYVTDPSQLPDYPELEGYDENYFRDRALLLVTETVSSGTVNVKIQSVVVENGVATVILDHQVPTGLGTADMATWLLWVEVDAGLELTWKLENPAMKPDTDKNERY